MATKEYELIADHYNEVERDSSGKLKGYTPRSKGDKIKLDDARAAELIASGAIVDPDAKAAAGKPGEQTKPPKGDGDGGDAPTVTVPEGDPTDSWTLAQMKAWGEANNVDLSGEKKKDSALAAIAAARA